MNLLDYFFRNWNKREEVISEDLFENSNDLWADSVTTGWEYTCNLLLTTLRICIKKMLLVDEEIKS